MLTKISPEKFYAKMSEFYESETGLNPAAASDIGIRMKALAEELAFLSGEIEAAYKNAFAQTASGEALSLHAERSGITRKEAAPSGGALRFFRNTPALSDINIPGGILCAAQNGARFKTSAPGAIKRGGSVTEIPAMALEAGETGNVPPGSVTAVITGLAGVAGVTNPTVFMGGADAEPDDILRERLMSHIANPPGFYNEAYYREKALAHPGVRAAKLLPDNSSPGLINIIIAVREDSAADIICDELAAELKASAPAGINIAVSSAVEANCEPAATVKIKAGFNSREVLDTCEKAVSAYISGLRIGEAVKIAGLTACLMVVAGVENLRISAPGKDLAVPEDGIAVISSFEIAEVAEL